MKIVLRQTFFRAHRPGPVLTLALGRFPAQIGGTRHPGNMITALTSRGFATQPRNLRKAHTAIRTAMPTPHSAPEGGNRISIRDAVTPNAHQRLPTMAYRANRLASSEAGRNNSCLISKKTAERTGGVASQELCAQRVVDQRRPGQFLVVT